LTTEPSPSPPRLLEAYVQFSAVSVAALLGLLAFRLEVALTVRGLAMHRAQHE
jgi:hypothetical protein